MHERRLGTIGWGMFCLWLGIALFAGLQLNTTLIGVGIIMLALQGLRKYFGMKIEIFWIIAGAVFLLFNLFNIPDINIPVIPIILVAFGVIFIISAVRKR